MYAIIQTGGKQYRIEEGDVLRVEKLDGEVGDEVTLEEVLVLGGDELIVGAPLVEGAKVTATVKAQGKAKKVVIGKFKAKKGYKRKQGHRQPYTLLEIGAIEG